jgi:hypothetical protein
VRHVIESGRGGVGDLIGLTLLGVRSERLDPPDRFRV